MRMPDTLCIRAYFRTFWKIRGRTCGTKRSLGWPHELSQHLVVSEQLLVTLVIQLTVFLVSVRYIWPLTTHTNPALTNSHSQRTRTTLADPNRATRQSSAG